MKHKLLRSLWLSLALVTSALMAQINTPSGAVVPFGANASYAGASLPTNLPTGGQFGRSQDAANAYIEWKQNYVVECNANPRRYRVRFDEPNRTVSEGIAYGMLLAAYAADKDLFDGLWNYYKFHSNSRGFMHWRIDGCTGVSGQNGAADAEVDAAYALLIAENQWPSINAPYDYISEAGTLLNNVVTWELHPSSNQLINGDGWGFGDNCRNPAYQAPAYFREFALRNTNNSGRWNSAVTAAYGLVTANADATTGLVSDWSNPQGVRNTCNPGGLGYAATDGYGYDACRNPWRMAHDVIWNGTTTASSGLTIVNRIASYVNSRGVNNIGGPLFQNGNNYPGYSANASFISTFAMAVFASNTASQALKNSMYTRTVQVKDPIQNFTLSGYYGNTLRVLSLFMQTGNFWKYGTTSEREVNVRQGILNIESGSSFDFQNGQLNTNKDIIFTIENLGFANLTLTPTPVVTITGDASFTIQTQPATTTLALGQSTTFTIRFRPTTTGLKTATITVRSNDADEANYIINLTGTGTVNATAPRLVVRDGGTTLNSGANLAVGQFTTSSVGYKVITIRNTGDAPLNLTSAAFTGANPTLFSTLFPTTFPTAIAIGDSLSFTIGYAASATANNHSAILTIANNDPTSPSFVLNLTASSAACGTVVANSRILMDYDGNINVVQPFTPLGTWNAAFSNPARSSINPSPRVARYVRPTTGDYDIIRYTPCGTTNFTISTQTPSISILFYSPAVGVEVVCAAQRPGTPNPLPIYPDFSSNIMVTTTKANQWELLTFDFSRLITTNDVSNFRIMDFQVDPLRKYAGLAANASEAARTFFFDEIRYATNPCLSDLSGVLLDYDTHNNLFRTNFFNIVAPVANPSKTGLNTSDLVGRFTKSAAITNFSDGNRFNGCNNRVDFSTRKIVSMLVYSTVAGAPIIMNAKIPDGPDANTDPDDAASVTVVTEVANQWHRVYFDFSAITVANIPNVFGFDLFFDPLATRGAQTYHFDDIRFEEQLPCLTSIPATGILNNYETLRNVNLEFNPLGTLNQFATNPNATGQNTSTGVATFVRPTTGVDVIRYRSCGNNFTLTPGRSVFTLQVLASYANAQVILSLKEANGTTVVAEALSTTGAANTWSTLSFDLSSALGSTSGRFLDIIFDPNRQQVGSVAARTYHFDNLRYSQFPEIAVSRGTTNINTGDTLQFGNVNVGDSLVINLAIRNNGGGDLNLMGTNPIRLLGADAVHYAIRQSSTFTSTIPSGGATSISVVFKPTSAFAKLSAIEIANNDSDENPFFINLRGIGTAPEINLAQGTTNIPSGSGAFNFGSVAFGSSSGPLTFSIQNLGNAALSLTGTPRVAISGANAADFTIVQTTVGASVAAGGFANFTINFTPGAGGARTATISIANNDSDENPYTFTLNGTGTVPDINLTQGTTNIVSGSGSYGFGNINVGASSSAIVFTIQNLGNGNLSLTGTPIVAITGANANQFTVVQTATAASLAPSGSTTFTITFVPTTPGAKTATISIANNDPDENPYTFAISGTGLAPEINLVQGTTNIASGTGSYSFGNQNVGVASTAVTFTIQNTGNGVLNLSGTPRVAVTGANAADFTVNVTSTTATVAAAGSTTFSVTFNPSATGARTATISIPNNDSDENPYTFSVTGTGTAADINVRAGTTNIANAGTYNFGSFVSGTTAPVVTFTIENTGNAVLNLTGTPNRVAITGANAADFTIVQTGVTATVNGGTSVTFTVSMATTTVGSKVASLSIANNVSGKNPYTVNLSGTVSAAPVADISVTQGTINLPNSTGSYSFGSILTGQSSSAVIFTVANTGTAALNLSGTPIVSVTGGNASDFVVSTTSTTTTVGAGSSTTFTIVFTPSGLGTRNATVSIANNVASKNPYTFSVTGIGIAPSISVLQGSTAITNNIGSYSFTNVQEGTSSSAVSFTIQNAGTAPLNLSGTPRIAISGANAADFVISQTAVGATVNAGESVNFTITFSPATVGAKTATVSIANNSALNPFTFTLNGTATATPAPSLVVTRSGDALLNNSTQNFGNVLLNNSESIVFAIGNLGNAVLNVTNITIAGVDASQYRFVSESGTNSVSVPAGSSSQLTVIFEPGTQGIKLANLTFATNAPSAGTFTINLSGTGVVPNSFVDFTLDNVVVLPNPTTKTVEVNIGMTGNSLISLSDANGVEVYNTSTNAQQFSIDMTSLPAGQYVLCVSNGKSKWFKKIVKQ